MLFPIKKLQKQAKKNVRKILGYWQKQKKQPKHSFINSQLKFLKFFLYGFFLILLGASVGLVIWLYLLVRELPDPSQLSTRTIVQSTKIWDRTGKVLLYNIHGEEKRTIIPFSEIPDSVKKATLAAEDANFYQHPAFDLKAMIRAGIRTVFFRSRYGIQGGSTITQQLVKNTLLSPEKLISRKIKEIILAIQLEQKYTKDEILELYLNQIPYGSNAYGIEAASQTFFEKPAKNLTLAEAALLAALPKRPSYLSPYGNHTDKLKARQEYILDRMAQFGWISQEEAQKAKEEKLKFAKQRSSIKAPHFVIYTRLLLEEMFDNQYIETAGLNVITSLDWELQQIAEKAVYEGALRNEKNWKANNASLVAQNPKTGEILAMVGSRDYFDTKNDGNLNVALQVRQPGSSFKPFVYLEAFAKGYTPETVLFDVFTEFSLNCNPDGTPKSGVDSRACYHPQNYDEKFRGPVTLRQALAQSLNVPSVKLLYLVGIRNAIETAKNFGITTLNEKPEFYGLSLILGGGGVRLIDMVQAYSVFANEGILQTQTAILKIIDSQGQVIYEAKPQQKRVFDPNPIRILNNILSDDAARVPMFQPGGPLTIPGYSVAVKTGTSQDYRDAWVIGYSPGLVSGVWVGNNDYSPMQRGGAGGMAAAPIWNDFMRQALTKFEKRHFAAYTPLPAPKPILRGEYMVETPSGIQIHSILYWINKEDPLGPEPTNPFADAQFINWENGVRQWVSERFPDSDQITRIQPQDTTPRIFLLEPTEEYIIKPNTALQITARVQSFYKILSVRFLFNQEQVFEFSGNEENLYSLYFLPKTLKEQNSITIEVKDERGHRAEVTRNNIIAQF